MADDGADDGDVDDDLAENDPHRFDRLPATEADREVADRATREGVVAFWRDRYGVDPAVWNGYSFWEKGAGKVWAFASDVPASSRVEAIGLAFLRTGGEHWKPRTDAVQRFGRHATAEDTVVDLSRERAARFLAGEDQTLDWDGDWGYLIVRHDYGGRPEPVGVGLFLHGELRSQVPKGRRREL